MHRRAHTTEQPTGVAARKKFSHTKSRAFGCADLLFGQPFYLVCERARKNLVQRVGFVSHL